MSHPPASGTNRAFPQALTWGRDPRSPLELDLTSGEITTVLWATGFRPDHSWLDIPVRDRTGHICHDGGVVTGAPGLYILGMPVLRTRASTYIHGATDDTDAIVAHLHGLLRSSPARRRPQGTGSDGPRDSGVCLANGTAIPAGSSSVSD